jgi:hypothetical protein
LAIVIVTWPPLIIYQSLFSTLLNRTHHELGLWCDIVLKAYFEHLNELAFQSQEVRHDLGDDDVDREDNSVFKIVSTEPFPLSSLQKESRDVFNVLAHGPRPVNDCHLKKHVFLLLIDVGNSTKFAVQVKDIS